jgi:hypothetical protein
MNKRALSAILALILSISASPFLAVAQEKKEVLGVKEAVLQEEKELQEELKALEILQDQEDQEEVNTNSLIFL